MDFGHDEESLWISTTNSSVKNWSLKAFASEKSQAQSHKPTTRRSNSPRQTPTSLVNSTNTQNVANNLLTSNNPNSESSSLSSFLLQSPLNSRPSITIKGTASIKQYHILNDKRYIVTKDTDENVCVWDVLQVRQTESLGKENYENAIKIRQRFISIPNWFTVDLKLGVLTINLDESDWNSAWINFRDMDSNHVRQTQHIDLSDAKVNYGSIFLESLFKNCLFIYPFQIQTCSSVIVSQSNNNSNSVTSNDGSKCSIKENPEDSNQAGLLRFNIPEHITIIFSEVAGRTLYRIEVKDLSRENEQNSLSNIMPSWIIDALLGVIFINNVFFINFTVLKCTVNTLSIYHGVEKVHL